MPWRCSVAPAPDPPGPASDPSGPASDPSCCLRCIRVRPDSRPTGRPPSWTVQSRARFETWTRSWPQQRLPRIHLRGLGEFYTDRHGQNAGRNSILCPDPDFLKPIGPKGAPLDSPSRVTYSITICSNSDMPAPRNGGRHFWPGGRTRGSPRQYTVAAGPT